MPKLIIIRGNSGSGKTTVAKALQQRFGHNTMLISQDVVRRDILKTKDGADTKALPLLQMLLKYGRENSEIVILEGIMNANWYKPLFELALIEFGNNIYAYYYDLPFEETLARHHLKPNKDEFGEIEMRNWWNENDYTNIIPERTITKDLSIEKTIESIYEDVMIGQDRFLHT